MNLVNPRPRLTRLGLVGALAVASAWGSTLAGSNTLSFNEISIYRVENATRLHDREFVELVGTPGQSMDNVFVMVIEGEGAAAGTVDRAFRIPTGRTMPTDGYFVIGDVGVSNTDVALPAGPFLEEGTQTFFLLYALDPNQVLGLLNTDLDADNNGVLDVPIETYGVVLDAVAVQTNDPSTTTYATPVLARGHSPFPPGVFRLCDYPNSWSIGSYLNADLARTTGNPPTPGAANLFGSATLFGVPHDALGSAWLCTNEANGEVEVTGTGSSGQDGVRVELGASQGWRAAIDAGEMPAGSSLGWAARGIVDGLPDTLAWTGRVESDGNGRYAFFADASAMGAAGHLVELLEDGRVVASRVVPTDEELFSILDPAVVIRLPLVCITIRQGPGGLIIGEAQFKDIPTDTTIDGPGPVSNTAGTNYLLRWQPVDAASTPTAFNSCDITIIGSPTGFTLSKENLIQSDHPQHGIGAARVAGDSDQVTVSDLSLGQQYGAAVDYSQAGKVGTVVIDPVGDEFAGDWVRVSTRSTSGELVAETGVMNTGPGSYAVVGDYSHLHPTDVLVEGLLDGVVMSSHDYDHDIIGGDDIHITIHLPPIIHPCAVVGTDHVAGLLFDQDTLVQLAQDEAVLVDELRITARQINAPSIINSILPRADVVAWGYAGFQVRDVIDPGSVLFHGITHEAIGAARLTAVEDDVLVGSNMGQGGQDWVSANLGSADFGELGAAFPSPSTVPLDAQIEFRTYAAPEAALPDYLVQLGLRRAGDAYQVFGDLTRLGGTSGVVELRNNGSLITSQPFIPITFPPIIIFDWHQSICRGTTRPCLFDNGHHSTLQFEDAVQVQLGDGPIVSADTIDIVVTDAVPPDDSVYRLNFKAWNMDGSWLTDSGVGRFGLAHDGLGDARLTAISNGILVTNIGDTGLDGVRIDTEPADSINIAWDISNSILRAQNTLIAGARGSVGGVDFHSLGTSRATVDSDNSILFSADYRPLGSTSQLVQVYSNGQLVQAFPALNGDLARTTVAPIGCGKNPPNVPPNPPCFIWRFPPDTPFQIPAQGGTAFPGDELRILAQDPTLTIDSIQSFQMRFGATPGETFPDVTIVSESITRPSPCPCDWDHDGVLNSQDFFNFLSDFFTVGADFNQDGMTNSQDFFDFLACFFGSCG